MNGTAIITNRKKDEILRILLGPDNTHGSLDNEGYGIIEKGSVGGAKVLVFFSLNRTPIVHRYLVFVVGGTIYANKIARVIVQLLISRNISFRTDSRVKVPKHIKLYIKRHTR